MLFSLLWIGSFSYIKNNIIIDFQFIQLIFTLLESPSIYAGDGRNTCKSRSIASLLRAGSKLCPF
ncbi:MAG: hypothetical protein A2026_10240 [Deltaproteobacteria bacterium RBG_19FT_COMBO_46_12]|nr:MAG: hypothetical protein A2026_10240 [Deltaproteobacteria bacterium RBG_19FT_COMBO_46_12]